MEQHPVPQNILDVEFKLFGAFSLRQFMRIVFGGLGALLFFIIPLPGYIKLPLMGASLLMGVGLAIVPNLGTWISGYLKSLFISPRYVWKKDTQAPEVLTKNFSKNTQNKLNVSKAKKQEDDEISLQRLLDEKGDSRTNSILSAQSKSDPLEARDQNIDRLLTQIFDKPGAGAGGATAPVNNQAQQNPSPPVQNQSVSPKGAVTKRQKTKNDYLAEIRTLKNELRDSVKDQNYKEKEAQILERIADLNRELSFSNQQSAPSALKQVSSNSMQQDNSAAVIDQKGQPVLETGSAVFGVVVDAKDAPIPKAEIHFKNAENNLAFQASTSEDGRFVTDQKLPMATYDVSLTHPNFRFNSYKITVGAEKLPAYKLRAK